MRRLIPLALAGLLALPAQANDLQTIYEQARQTDPEYQAAVAAFQAERFAKPLAFSALLPQADAGARYTRQRQRVLENTGDFPRPAKTIFNSFGFSVQLIQPLFRMDAFLNLGTAELQVLRASLELQLAEQQLLLRAAQAYFVYLSAAARQRAAEAEQQAVALQLEQNQERFDVGLIPVTDVRETQARSDLAEANLILARQELANARDELRAITGQGVVGELPDLRADLPLVLPPADGLEPAAVAATTDNLTVQLARVDEQLAAREVKRLRSQHLPTLDLVGEYQLNDDTDSDSTFGGIRSDNSVIGLQLSLPLSTGGRITLQTRQALKREEQAAAITEQRRRQTDRDLRAAWRGVIAGARRVEALRLAVRSAETALEATEAGLEVGTRTTVDVLNAQRELFRARTDLAQARYDYVLQGLQLGFAGGKLVPDDLLRLNEQLDRSIIPESAAPEPTSLAEPPGQPAVGE